MFFFFFFFSSRRRHTRFDCDWSSDVCSSDLNAAAVNHSLLQIISEQPHLFRTITVDNGTEFHAYEQIERLTGVRFYFATPYHSWERGTNENTKDRKSTRLNSSHSQISYAVFCLKK